MSDYGSLFQLQEIDLNLDKQKAILEKVDGMLNSNTSLGKLTTEVSEMKQELQHLQLKQKELEFEVTTLKDKFSLLSDRMYGGKLRNTKELASLQEETAYLQKLHNDKEEELLDVLLSIESAETLILSTARNLEMLTISKKEECSKLLIEREKITTTVTNHLIARDRCAAKLPASLLTSYTKIRAKKRGVAVATLAMDMCSVCRVVIPSGELQDIKRTKKPRSCDGCGRILVVS